MDSKLIKLALKHGRNSISESLYLRFGYDITRPVFNYALATYRCNARCLSCKSWEEPVDSRELTIEEWQRALLSLKDFTGEYSISFSGGEPLIKKGFIDLLEFCRRNNIHAGFTTNGSCFTETVTRRLAVVEPFNVNISVDAPSAEVHDYLRGRPGLFEKVSEGTKSLIREREARNSDFPIIIKPTISSVNFRLMPELVDWAMEIGANAINFQPVDNWNWSPETHELLWVDSKNLPELGRIVDKLIEMKNGGAPILNSTQSLQLIVPHFRGDKAPVENLPCRVGLGYSYISPTGDIRICPMFDPIGNIRENEARDIWYGDQARKIRKQTTQCQRLCLLTCVTNKTIRQKVAMGLKLFKGF